MDREEQLTVDLEAADGIAVVSADGELDVATAPRLRDHLHSAIALEDRPVVVDLARVTFMDSTGLHLLLNALRRLTRQDRRFAVVCPPDGPRRVFQLTRLEDTFDLHDRLEDAVAAVRPGA